MLKRKLAQNRSNVMCKLPNNENDSIYFAHEVGDDNDYDETVIYRLKNTHD